MNRRTMYLILCLSLFSLVLTALMYYGVIRHFNLSCFPCESYGKQYLRIPRANSTSKVIVSLATDKTNLSEDKTLKKTVNSLLSQTMRPDQFIISTPPNVNMQIPRFLKDNNILIVHDLSKDYEAYTSLISPLLREKDGNTKIILVQPGVMYGEDFVESLVDASEKNPDHAVAFSAYSAKDMMETGTKVENSNGDVLNITQGVLIKPRFLSADVLNVLEDAPKNSPDAFLSAHLAKQNVSKILVSENENSVFHAPSFDEQTGLMFYAVHFPSLK